MVKLNRFQKRHAKRHAEEYMSRFLDPLKVETLDGQIWTTLEDMDYEIGCLGSKRRVVVPAGTKTDFGSVPRCLWALVSPIGHATRAFVLHDFLYQSQPYPRQKCDAILAEAMDVLSCQHWYTRIIYLGVRAGGWIAWNAHRRALNALKRPN
jgi:hypothetical protein